MKTFVALFLAVLAVNAHQGLDLSIYSGVVSTSTFQCLQGKGYDYMILEEWVENHAASNFEANYKNAVAAGYKEVDAYAFICNTCKGTHTANDVISGIKGNLGSGFSGMIWLDIEPCSGCWSSSGNQNYEFAQSIAKNLESAGYKIGIYSSGWAWDSVMSGVSSTWFSQYPLWYAHYDNVESFNDPSSYKFAGWTQPAIKQYSGDDKGICNVPDYDINWSPSLVHTNGESGNAENKETPAPANNTPAPANNTPAPANNEEEEHSLQAVQSSNASTSPAEETSPEETSPEETSPEEEGTNEVEEENAKSEEEESAKSGSEEEASKQEEEEEEGTGLSGTLATLEEEENSSQEEEEETTKPKGKKNN